MSHLHTLLNKPQIYTLLLEGDDKHPYYLYIGATENMSNRWSQHVQGHEAFQSGANDGWGTPNFTRCVHKPRMVLELQFVDDPGRAEIDTFLKWFHVLGCSMEQVRGADWCRPELLTWETSKMIRGRPRPSLRQAYDAWLERGMHDKVDAVHKSTLLALPRLYI